MATATVRFTARALANSLRTCARRVRRSSGSRAARRSDIAPRRSRSRARLAEEGFLYDSSQHDSPRIRRRLTPATVAPHLLSLASGRKLWEFPVAVWRTPHARVPVGGASYWAVLPRGLVLRGLREAGSLAGLYLHPHELDPQPLDADLPRNAAISQRLHGALRAAQRNTARRAAAGTLRAIAGSFELIPYGEAHARLAART